MPRLPANKATASRGEAQLRNKYVKKKGTVQVQFLHHAHVRSFQSLCCLATHRTLAGRLPAAAACYRLLQTRARSHMSALVHPAVRCSQPQRPACTPTCRPGNDLSAAIQLLLLPSMIPCQRWRVRHATRASDTCALGAHVYLRGDGRGLGLGGLRLGEGRGGEGGDRGGLGGGGDRGGLGGEGGGRGALGV